MRISFLSPHISIAGGTRAILKYSDLLAARGHNVEITLPARNMIRRTVKRWKARLLREPRWQPTRARLRFVPSLAPQHLRPADVTIATAWRTAYALQQADEHVGGKAYLIQHYESLYHGPAAEVDPTYQFGLRNIVISHWLHDLLDEKFGVPSDVLVTPVDHDVFFPRPVERPSVFRVCMLYHDQDWKDVDTGLDAIRQVRATGRPVQLVLFGATAPERMQSLADEVHYRKSQDDLARVYSSCDVYLCSSWYEGLGMPAMEAMACGCALVTTDTGGGLSYAEHDRTALVAEQRNPGALAEHLIALFDDRDRLQALQDAGRRRILSFQWPAAADRLVAILEQAANAVAV